MKLKFKYSERIVGAFVLIALIIFVLSLGFLIVKQKIFEKKYYFTTKFNDATGLGASTPVYFKGFKIGIVNNIDLTNDNLIEAELEIYEEFRTKIVKNSALHKTLNPITSISSIEFIQGPKNILLPEGGFIPSLDIPEGKMLLAQGIIKKQGNSISNIVDNLEILTENLNKDDNADQGALFRTLYNLANATGTFNLLAERINSEFNNLEKLSGNKNLLAKTIINISNLTDSLKTSFSVINKVLNQADTLAMVYSKPDGLLERMIDPTKENLINPIKTTIIQVNETITKLDEIATSLNSRSPELNSVFEDLKDVLKQMQSTFETLNMILPTKSSKK
jgi:phospholipid/cholesterol/gamma-HCH transport system substrate-binding protein